MKPGPLGSWRDESLAHGSEFQVTFELPSARPAGAAVPQLIVYALRAAAVTLDGRTLYDDRADESQRDWHAPRLLPLGLMLLGAGRACVRAGRGETDGLASSAVAVFSGLTAVIWIPLAVPTYSAIEATHRLGFLPCRAALSAAGYEMLARRTWLRLLLAGGIGCWALFGYAAYFAVG